MFEGKKISELDLATSLQDASYFPIVNNGVTRRVTFATIASHIENRLPESEIGEIKADVQKLQNHATESEQKIDALDVKIDDLHNQFEVVDEMVQGQNATIRNCVSTVNDLEETIAQTHFDDVLELEEQVRRNSSVIPAQASAQNQLADKNFVNSTVGTNTSNYISDNGEPFTSVLELQQYSGIVTNNDYAFVTGIDSDGNVYFDRYKASVSGENVTWAKEYRLNNSSFTSEQWAAIQSGITAEKVALIPDSVVAQIDDDSKDTTHAWSGAKVAEEIEIVDNKNNYSTEETIVGKWVDGKPIYRKVFIDTSELWHAQDSVIGQIANFKELISIIATALNTSVAGWVTNNEAGNSRCYGYVKTNGEVHYRRTEISTNPEYTKKVIVEYTKTTD